MSSEGDQATNTTPPSNASETTDNSNANNAGNVRRNQNTRRPNPTYNGSTSKFKGKIEDLEALTTKDESKKNNFTKFKTDILQYVLKHFSHAIDIVPALKAGNNPITVFNKTAPSKSEIRTRLGLVQLAPSAGETDDARLIREATNKDTDETASAVWQAEIKLFVQKTNELRTNMAKLWSIIKDQCSHSLQEELRAEKDFLQKEKDYDVLWLLHTLQHLTSGINDTSNRYYSMYHIIKDFYKIRQGKEETLASYFERFETAVNLVDMTGGSVTNFDLLLDEEVKTNPTATENDVMQCFLGIAFLECADSHRYSNLWKELRNDLAKGVDRYPTSLAKANTLLRRWTDTKAANNNNYRPRNLQLLQDSGGRGGRGTGGRGTGGRSSGGRGNNRVRSTHNAGSTIAGTDGETHGGITCHACGADGHYAPECPNPTPVSRYIFHQDLQNFTLQQLRRLLLLDTGSTFNSSCTPDLVENIRTCEDGEGIRAYTNSGSTYYNHEADVTLLPAMKTYYNTSGIANVLSFFEVQKLYHVKFDSKATNEFYVRQDKHTWLRFKCLSRGLYYVDMDNLNDHICSDSHVLLFSTVQANKEFFSHAEIEGAENARILQQRLHYPSDAVLQEALDKNFITDTKVIGADVERAEAIMGKAASICKGKTVRKRINSKYKIRRFHIPSKLVTNHPKEQLDTDFMYVQGAPYLVTKGQGTKFRTIQTFNRISKRNKHGKITYKRGPTAVIAGIKKVKEKYEERGFAIEVVNGDNEFEKLRGKIGTDVNICGADQHVGGIEREIRTIKERTRCVWSDLPYQRVPKLMIDEFLDDLIKVMNDFPNKHAISRDISASAMVLARGKLNCELRKLSFGSYCEVKCPTTNDAQTLRTVSAIALRPSNEQGGYYFMSLETGRRIHGYIWTELPISDHIIETVHQLAENEGAEDLDDEGVPIFEWESGVPILTIEEEQLPQNQGATTVPDDDTDIEDSSSDDDVEAVESDDSSYLPNDDSDSDSSSHDSSTDNHDDNLDNDSVQTYDNNDNNDHSDIEDDDGSISDNTDHVVDVDKDDNEDNTNNYDPAADVEAIGATNTTDSTATNTRPRRNTRAPDRLTVSHSSQREKTYDATIDEPHPNGELQFTEIDVNQILTENDKEMLFESALHVLFQQMSAKEGIKKFGEEAVAAMFKEYMQIDNLKVVGRVDKRKLTRELKRKALRAVNLIKKKRCGKIKGRTCANGAPHRKFVPREEATSPTLKIESLMGLILFAAVEKRDVAIFDVPGAYLHAELGEDKFVLLKLEDDFVKIMCDVNPEYKDDILYEDGKPVLYLQILKALYGMIESALLWYSLYTEVLLENGFKLNPVDKCVANKEINGKQCTIGWYVDDNFLSHDDSKVVDDVVAMVESYFPGLQVERGKMLNFLGMEIRFFDDGKASIGTVQYLKGMIKALEEELGFELTKEYSTPAGNNLFKIDRSSRKIDEKKADIFRRYVPMVLWTMKRSRPDMETTVSFLMKRVSEPLRDDWHKFMRMMCFIKQTIEDVRIIGADSLVDMLTMVDSAHAVHENMRGHTGGLITFGTGVVDQKSSTQKMNARSSTDTEHIGTSEYLPKNIYFSMFFEHQGYKLRTNYLCKDNSSEIKLIKNGMDSATWNSKHVAVKHFWVTDRIKNGDIEVQYCPTKQMVADYFSKPVQGALFHIFRNAIMGWAHIKTVFEDYVPPEERVEMKAPGPKTKLVQMKKLYRDAVLTQNSMIHEELKESRDLY